MKVKRKIIEIDENLCDGCGQCVLACAEGALEIIDGKARVVADVLCDGLGACLGECPKGALKIIEREAGQFDDAAVERHLKTQKTVQSEAACACPSVQVGRFQSFPTAGKVGTTPPGRSNLSHWPIQIRLIPPTAPYLKNADLLIVADCTAIALATINRDLVKGRVVMMGCPKLDDTREYVNRFAEVFRCNDINSITTVIMEVPCCGRLPKLVQKGLELSGKRIPAETVVVSRKGEILAKRDDAEATSDHGNIMHMQPEM